MDASWWIYERVLMGEIGLLALFGGGCLIFVLGEWLYSVMEHFREERHVDQDRRG